MLGSIIRQVCSDVRHKHKLLILSCLSDFMTEERSISQLWSTVEDTI